MEPEQYVKMRELEDTYWWFVGRRVLVRTLLDGRVARGASFLDVGCGTGAMSGELSEIGTVTSLDFEHAALDFARSRGLSRLVQASAEALPFPSDTFDAVTALDVIEHLDDDHAAASEIRRVLKPGGIAVVSVPAFAFLWSEHDVALHHRRRYRIHEFRDLFRRAGMEVEHASYVMTALFPAVAAVRMIQKVLGSHRKTLEQAKTTHPKLNGPVNGALTGLLRAEAQVVRRVSLPFGVSMAGVFRKGGRM